MHGGQGPLAHAMPLELVAGAKVINGQELDIIFEFIIIAICN
jgi:hypothetical protein